ncbi:unnamed protein product [Pleuronectes platessa]|uniref:Uncharacterized protein n=1 Tax=Pleuronectes platessa TaxID=8262 RepID=A0A9N7Z1L1_PLEPL|nr:unnamed protein product [Pleuronectes platessa]
MTVRAASACGRLFVLQLQPPPPPPALPCKALSDDWQCSGSRFHNNAVLVWSAGQGCFIKLYEKHRDAAGPIEPPHTHL